MKKLSNSLLLMLVASAFLMFACGDDEAPKKQFTVEGDSYELSHGYSALLGDGEDDDGNTIYGHYVFLTGKDLEVSADDGISFSGSDDLVYFILIGSEDDIAEGTYEFGDDEAAGVFGQFTIYTDYTNSEEEDDSFDRVFAATAGTIKVSKSGGKTTFKINITEFVTLDEEGDEIDGEGSIKGYFRGELEDVTPEEVPVRKPSGFKNSFSDIFKK